MIPVIDLNGVFSSAGATAAEKEKETEGKKLVRACEEWGCFRVINHGIPEKLLLDMKSVVRSLFDLPLEVKQRNADVISGSGYVAPNEMNPLYEAIGLYDAGSPDAVDVFCAQLGVTPQQREVIRSYSRQLHGLAIKVATKMAESLGLSKDPFEGWPSQFRINKYAFTEETVGSSGVCIHTDSGFLTVLQEDNCVGGLEVMDKNGTFVAVDPVPGSFLLNLGDIAKAWSNGRFRNLKHRVQCKEAVLRYSIALFLLGPRLETVEPPPELVDPEHPRLYRPFTFEELRNHRISTGSREGEILDLMYAVQEAHPVA